MVNLDNMLMDTEIDVTVVPCLHGATSTGSLVYFYTFLG